MHRLRMSCDLWSTYHPANVHLRMQSNRRNRRVTLSRIPSPRPRRFFLHLLCGLAALRAAFYTHEPTKHRQPSAIWPASFGEHSCIGPRCPIGPQILCAVGEEPQLLPPITTDKTTSLPRAAPSRPPQHPGRQRTSSVISVSSVESVPAAAVS